MTKDEIIDKDFVLKMARQVSNTPIDATSTPDLFGVNQIVKFAKLVAQHAQAEEREACARLCAEDNVQAMNFTGGTFVGGYFSKKIIDRGEA